MKKYKIKWAFFDSTNIELPDNCQVIEVKYWEELDVDKHTTLPERWQIFWIEPA